MSILGSIESGLDKATQFVLNIFTKTSAVLAVLQKISPSTVAAMLAVFYDVMGFVQEGATIAGEVTTGNYGAAIGTVLSATTQTLLNNLKTGIASGEAVIVSDLNELGIAVKTAVPAATT